MAKHPNHIVVEGPIGAGKTTLAKRLAQSFDMETLLELPESNPFLNKFYTDPKHLALPTQLYFLCQRAQQLKHLRQQDMFHPVCVADFLLEKDRLFAELTLDEDELGLYLTIYDAIAFEVMSPDLVIYLQAPVETLYKRVRQRGRPYEKQIDKNYLQKVVDAYVDFFYYYTVAPLLIVNTDEFDLATDQHHYQLLLDHLGGLSAGRHYFNPNDLEKV